MSGTGISYPHCACCKPGCRARHDEPCEHEAAMSGTEAVSGTAPGRAAYEAYTAGTGIDWERLGDRHRAAWDAAAQAAVAAGVIAVIKAAEGDTIVIAFRNCISQQQEHEFREVAERFAPGVRFVFVLDADSMVNADDVKPAPELAAAMAETRQLRELVREIRKVAAARRAGGLT